MKKGQRFTQTSGWKFKIFFVGPVLINESIFDGRQYNHWQKVVDFSKSPEAFPNKLWKPIFTRADVVLLDLESSGDSSRSQIHSKLKEINFS